VLVDSILIEWPSGIKQYRTGVLPNQILNIEEDLVNAVPNERPSLELKVFPNPTHSNLHLQASFGDQSGDITLEVFGDTGQMFYKTSYPHVTGLRQTHLDLRKLQIAPGQYIVRLSGGV